jgi:hypothetical protein
METQCCQRHQIDFCFRGRRFGIDYISLGYFENLHFKVANRNHMNGDYFYTNAFEIDEMIGFWGIDILSCIQPVIFKPRVEDNYPYYYLEVDLEEEEEEGGYWCYLLNMIICNRSLSCFYGIRHAETYVGGDGDELIEGMILDLFHRIKGCSPKSGLVELVDSCRFISECLEGLISSNPKVDWYYEYRELVELIRSVGRMLVGDV